MGTRINGLASWRILGAPETESVGTAADAATVPTIVYATGPAACTLGLGGKGLHAVNLAQKGAPVLGTAMGQAPILRDWNSVSLLS